MAPNIARSRPRWLTPLIAFLIGLLIGWWGIGWWLWPVTWTNALPPDLRAAERDQYLMLVAESYAATGNLQQATERLAQWPRSQLADDLARLQSRLENEDARRALQVQTLASGLGVARVPTPAPTARPSAAPAAPQGGPSLLRTVCTAGLWVLLVLVGVVLIVLLWTRLKKAVQGQEAGPAIGSSLGEVVRSLRGAPSVDEIAEAEKRRWPKRTPPAEQPPLGESAWAQAESELQVEAEEEELAAGPETGAREVREPAVSAPRRPVEAAVPTMSTGGTFKVNEYRASYRMGEPDYDEAFDIQTAENVYLGQCGLALTEPVGQGRDQAAALQVWLWDSSDPDTQVRVLLSEGASRNLTLRDQLKGNYEVEVVRPGATFELETYKLLLRGLVERVEYAEQDPLYTIFAELVVRLTVYRKA